MVKDGVYYGLALLSVALILSYFSVWLTIAPLLLGAFFLWFFRDPDRSIPQDPGMIVSPADGKVTDVARTQWNGNAAWRISIFLNVFNVHVNRSPIEGTIEAAEYKKGSFRNAMSASSADANEQNIVTVRGPAQKVVFKQIAGLLARRIVFTKKPGDTVARGERIGLIKFGSRCDVIFESSAEPCVKVGDSVKGGSSLLATLRVPSAPMQPAVLDAVGRQ
jgi:phosphatidylserine decarboxylase